MTSYGMSKFVAGSMEAVKEKVAAALKEQGFGILTEINVQKTLKEKIDVEIEPYLILGACNPHFADKALSADRMIGLLLPCNVVLRQVGEEVEVSMQDPEVMFSVVDKGIDEEFAMLPGEVKVKLSEALAKI